MKKSYTELMTLSTFEERYCYLRLSGIVGFDTFGFDRVFYQKFLQSREWRYFKRKIILRDTIGGYCCDLGCPDRAIIGDKVIVHHIEPVSMDDIKTSNLSILLDPDNVICTTHETHNAIHYGYEPPVIRNPIVRSKHDTSPWRKN